MVVPIEQCIFCSSNRLEIIQKIEIADIIELYKNSFDIDVSNNFNQLALAEVYKCHHCSLLFFNPKFAGDEKFYEQLQESEMKYYSATRPEFTIATGYIEPDNKVLEIGSGSGSFAEKIEKNCSYIGLEFNDKAIKNAGEKGISLIKQSIEEFAVTNKSQFDVVLSFHVLEHVTNPKEYITSSLECLRSNGKMIIAVPCNDSINTSNRNHVLNLPPHHISRWYIETMRRMAELHNLKIIDYHLVGGENNAKGNFEKKIMKKLLDFFYPKSPVVLVPAKYNKLSKFVFRLNRKLSISKLFKNETISSNMIFIFEKKA